MPVPNGNPLNPRVKLPGVKPNWKQRNPDNVLTKWKHPVWGPRIADTNKSIYSSDWDKPRGALFMAVGDQSKKPVSYESTPASKMLLERRNRNFPPPMIPPRGTGPGWAVPGSAYVTKNISDWGSPGSQVFGNLMGRDATINHEYEHAYRQKDYGERYHNNKFKEVGPTIGDLIFRGQQFYMDEGKPLKHTVKLPGHKQHDLTWMLKKAKEHGYWDGKPMTDLIFGTSAGRSWYDQMVKGFPRHGVTKDFLPVTQDGSLPGGPKFKEWVPKSYGY